MTLKTTIHSLSFVLVASVSSLALAGGLGVSAGANARVATPVGEVAAGGQPAAAVTTNTPNTAGAATEINGAATDTVDAANAATDKTRSTAGTVVDKSAATAADANADTHVAAKKIKQKKVKPAKSQTSDDVKAGAGATVKGESSGL